MDSISNCLSTGTIDWHFYFAQVFYELSDQNPDSG